MKLKDEWLLATKHEKVKFLIVISTIVIVGMCGIYFALLFAITNYYYFSIACFFISLLGLLATIKLKPKGKQ